MFQSVLDEIKEKYFLASDTWFEEHTQRDISFGDKTGEWFKLYQLSDRYYILSPYRISNSKELLTNISSTFVREFNKQGQDVLFSADDLYATGQKSLLAKEISEILGNHFRADTWSVDLPLFSWVSVMTSETSVVVSSDGKNSIRLLNSKEDALSFVREQLEDKRKMVEAAKSIHDWLISLCPDIHHFQNAERTWDTLYYFEDGPAFKFHFKKEFVKNGVSFSANYIYDNAMNHLQAENLEDLISMTKQRLIADVVHFKSQK